MLSTTTFTVVSSPSFAIILTSSFPFLSKSFVSVFLSSPKVHPSGVLSGSNSLFAVIVTFTFSASFVVGSFFTSALSVDFTYLKLIVE